MLREICLNRSRNIFPGVNEEKLLLSFVVPHQLLFLPRVILTCCQSQENEKSTHSRTHNQECVCVSLLTHVQNRKRESVCVCVFEHEREPERERRKQQLVSNKKPISCMLIIQVISLLKWNDMPLAVRPLSKTLGWPAWNSCTKT